MACNRPFTIQHGPEKYLVPCGWCRQCRIDRREEWTMRITSEIAKNGGAFITLTYNDENLPRELQKRHLQTFFKKFREITQKKIKYYAVGEYGEIGGQTNKYNNGLGRPHYHAIISGISPIKEKAAIEQAWGKGYIQTGGATHASIRYVLKYVEKQIVGRKQKEAYNGLEPPFCIMSKGIGREWLEQNIEQVEENEGIYYRGKIMPVPRYYKKISGIKGYQEQTRKREKILETMEQKHMDQEQARNYLGQMQENELIAKENLYGK